MNGEKRRQEILEYIRRSPEPVSGTKLAQRFQVSLQVIVQDIALLRAQNQDILSTHRGYVFHAPVFASRVFYVCHKDSEILEELNLIVDCGGKVEDVFIRHEVYGQLRADLSVDSRKKAAEFVKGIQGGKSSPLKNITSGYHYHTVLADSEQTLDEIAKELFTRGFLAEAGTKIS